MIDVYDSEAIVKIYRLLNKKCEAIDRFISNHAMYFGSNSYEFGSLDVCNNILDLMARKNQLINLKIIVDNALHKLSLKDKQVLYIKMNYSLSMNEICGILKLKERTAFRRIEQAFLNLAEALNNSKYVGKLERILFEEEWIKDVKFSVKEHRLAYREVCC